MSISGFTMAKNAVKLYYPIKEAISSILPIVDEFIVALGNCDSDDTTRKEILSIGSEKIKIIDTIWDIDKYPRGMENAHQTDIAKNHCKGDWLFYLQADEVVHEKYLQEIKSRCEAFVNDTEVEGFLFKYKHFWGDYMHYHTCHGWYSNEIRIVRNRKDIHSWQSAQSFRRIPNFDGINYRQHEGTFRLKVIELDAYIYHYGWVRPPVLMKNKTKALRDIHKGNTSSKNDPDKYQMFDYGPLQKLAVFKETHPKVMQERIKRFDWGQFLQYKGKRKKDRAPFKHEQLKYKVFTILKKYVLFMPKLGEFKNYIVLKR